LGSTGLTPKITGKIVQTEIWPDAVRGDIDVVREPLHATTYALWPSVHHITLFSAPPLAAGFRMKCATCEHENPVAAKFCEQCAAPLTRQCANCGTEFSATAKFCPQCGCPVGLGVEDLRFASPHDYTPLHLANKILAAKAAMEGERKQVTVMFADVKGSMEFVVGRDPEDAQSLLDPVIERMIEAVHHYEGTVNDIMGDGIMALFGAPLAHEDHAVRACYAALRMQENVKRYADQVQRTHGVPLAVRVGLNSGEIVVRAVRNDLRMDYTGVGQTAHLAARMEQLATPGSILATAETMKLAEGYVDLSPIGPLPVKGLTDRIPVYEVTGAGAARTRLQASAARGLTRFVNREAELDQLHSTAQVAATGRGQVVAIVGEAGVGKSRFLNHFLHSQPRPDRLILESSPASYGHTTPYLPVIELLRQYFNISSHDNTVLIREKVTGKIFALDPSMQHAIPPLLDLLDSLDDQHPFRSLDLVQHRQQTYQAVIRLLLKETEIRPALVVFEDLHWYDSLTLGLLNELFVAAQNAPLLLVVTYRLGYADAWKSQPNYRELRLHPLIDANLSEFLRVLLGSDESLNNLKSFLVDRASGIPFFVEEMVRTLIDTHVLEGERGSYHVVRNFSGSEVPPTLQAVLAARIDALPNAEKRLLQEAAVVGQDVPFGLLRSICGLTDEVLRRLLGNLQAAEFLYPTQLFPELRYTFKHSLTRDVAYGGVLRDRRREIHSHVLNAIETLYADRLAEQVEPLAHHAVRGELNEKAVHYLLEAARKAAARSALVDARTWFEQALDILKSLPESQATLEQAFDIRLELRAVLRQLGEVRRMLEYLREAEALAERLKDDRRRGRACGIMTTVLSTLDELDEALVTGTRAVEIATRAGDAMLRVITTSCLEQVYYYRGDYEHVVEIASENIAALPAEWTHEFFGLAVLPSVFTRGWLIMSLTELGRFSEAAKYQAEAIRLAEPTQHWHTIGWAHLAASMLHLFKGRWADAYLLVERWINVRRSFDISVLLPWAVTSSAWALAQLGDASEALQRVQEGEQLLERQTASGIVGHRSWGYYALSRACLQLRRLDEARRLGGRSLESSQRQPGFRAHALHLLGDLAAHPDQFNAETSAARYEQALALAQLHGMRPTMAHCHLGMGQLYRRTGQREQAHEHLSTAMMMLREMDMNFWLDQRESVTSHLDHYKSA
jgi:class 3 adenylate cyclase/tetratricopeptide (TPR) repeat protein